MVRVHWTRPRITWWRYFGMMHHRLSVLISTIKNTTSFTTINRLHPDRHHDPRMNSRLNGSITTPGMIRVGKRPIFRAGISRYLFSFSVPILGLRHFSGVTQRVSSFLIRCHRQCGNIIGRHVQWYPRRFHPHHRQPSRRHLHHHLRHCRVSLLTRPP